MSSKDQPILLAKENMVKHGSKLPNWPKSYTICWRLTFKYVDNVESDWTHEKTDETYSIFN